MPPSSRQLIIVKLLVSSLCSSALAAGLPPDYARDVRPILSDKCYKCHGPDAAARKADLRLDQLAGAERVFESSDGTTEFLRRITSDDPDVRMPPPGSKLSLDGVQIETLRRWSDDGAPYSEHWSFQPIRKPSLPITDETDWPKNEIDNFVVAKLLEKGWSPSPPAGRERLLRRLFFDVIGLPPTLEQIDQFLANDSPEAYERVVDRLLESQSYGERMAANWLDVARYGDSFGYQVDRERSVWPWRDWVIRAFNDNMPYDEFITWQLAGDLLSEATDEQILATTFNRLHSQKVEGGSVPEEFRVEYVADRTQTFATALLGLTLECARCHDHKYDPISQQEYYQLFAFFNSIDECGVYSYHTSAVPTPTLLLADKAQKKQMAHIEAQIAAAEQSLEALLPTRRADFDAWLARSPESRRASVRPLPDSPADLDLPLIPGRVAYLDLNGDAEGDNQSVPGVAGQAVRLSGDDGLGTSVGNFPRFEPFSVTLWLQTPDVKDRAVIFHRTGGWTDAGSRGYQLLIEEGKLSASLIHFWPGNAMRILTWDRIPVDTWVHLAMTYDGSSRAAGLRIYMDGQESPSDVVRDNLYKNITGGGGDNITIGQRKRDRGFTHGMVDDFQVFKRQLTSLEVAHDHDGTSLDEALDTDAAIVTAEVRDRLFNYYLANVDAAYREQLALLLELRKQRSSAVDGIPEIMVMRESPDPRPTHLLQRGAYDAPADLVTPETPAIFPPFPAEQARNRLGLAAWLTQPEHPLTARVAVNRIWQLLFGDGLVRTPEDFGSQGSAPTHPDLLDWLAYDLIEHNWNLKRMIKKIVMSSTYRQDSNYNSDRWDEDPQNLWLGRAPQYRLDAEMLRDNALATSGLLVGQVGGPPAKPYELAASFKPIGPDEGSGLYRRSLYTFWKRTAPAPMMMTLDAVKRDVCSVKRERTETPLAALVLLNSPQCVEAARVLAERMIREHGDNVDAMLQATFRTLVTRRADQKELATIRELYNLALQHYEEEPQQADELLSTGKSPPDENLPASRVAAMTTFALTVMNALECVMKY